MLSHRVRQTPQLVQDDLPAYAQMLADFHTAHANELRAMVTNLPLRPGHRVLDLACGDGVYAVWLAERVAPFGEVVAVDISPAFLELASHAAAASPHRKCITLQQGDAYNLPFDDNSFDLSWCAQSMFSLPDPLGALRELRRVTRSGGTVAVLENDLLHHMVLPLPPELELAVRGAHLASLEANNPEQLAVGRDLRTLCTEAGLAECRVMPYSTARHAPLGPEEYAYLSWQLDDLRQRTQPYLTPEMWAQFDAFTDPASPQFLLHQPDFVVTYLDMVALGVKP